MVDGRSKERAHSDFLVCETFLWTRYGLLSFANTASRTRGYTESSRKSREYAKNVSPARLQTDASLPRTCYVQILEL